MVTATAPKATVCRQAANLSLSATNGHTQCSKIRLLNHLIGKRELASGGHLRERRPSIHPFSSRLSSLRKRQSVASAMSLLGVSLIMPASRNRSA